MSSVKSATESLFSEHLAVKTLWAKRRKSQFSKCDECIGYVYLRTHSLVPCIALRAALNFPTKGIFDIVLPGTPANGSPATLSVNWEITMEPPSVN